MRATAIRALTLDAVATVLFEENLKFDPKAPHWADRDRFILSAGHGSLLIYWLCT